MSEDVKNQEVVEDVSSEEQLQDTAEELVENDEILDEESEVVEDGESLEEAKAKKEMSHGDEEEEHDDEEEEEHESKVKEIAVPKTKAGVIQAAVEMLKKARKEDAQKLFAKMTKMDESEDDGSVVKAVNAAPKAKDPKAKPSDAKAKIESVDFDEDLDALVAEEATLSDEFRGKAGAIFEAVLTSKLSSEIDRLEGEYAQNLEE